MVRREGEKIALVSSRIRPSQDDTGCRHLLGELMTNKQCPGCGRSIPVHKKRFQFHYKQDKNWIPRTECEMSNELCVRDPDDEYMTEADYQTWDRL